MSAQSTNAANALRQRAEALLATDPDACRPEDIRDVGALAQELAIHQAELEMQNEELRTAQLALNEARDQFAALFEHAPVGYVVLDAAGIVRRCNATWRTMVGRPDDDFRGTSFLETVTDEDAPTFIARFRAFFRNTAAKQIVVRIKRRGAEPFNARIETRPRHLQNDDDPAAARGELMLTVSDISDLIEARRAAENRSAELQRGNQQLDHISRVLKGIRNVNRLIVSESDPLQLVRKTCSGLAATMGYHNVWIALLGDGPGEALGVARPGVAVVTAEAGFDGRFHPLEAQLRRGRFTSCMRRALASDALETRANPVSDCPDCPLSGNYGGRAGLTHRLAFDGVTYGVIAASVPAAYVDNPEEQALFTELAADLAAALHRIATAGELARSRQRMDFVIAGSRLGTWEWNVQTDATVFNDTWAAMLGYTLEELAPLDLRTWTSLVHPEDLPEAQRLLADCVAGRTPYYACEFRMRRKDGSWAWILDRGRIMTWDDAGKPLSMFGTHDDITARKQDEARLRHQATMLDMAPTSITVHTVDGRFLYANRASATIHGYSREEFLALRLEQLDGEESTAEYPERVALLEREGKAAFEVTHRRKDGTRFPLKVFARFVEWDGRKVILSVAADITERKQAEEALQDSEQRLSLATRSANLGIWDWDIVGNALNWDNRMFQLYGIEPTTDHFGFETWEQAVHPDDRQRAAFAARAAVSGEGEYNTEFRIRQPDGTDRHIHATGLVIRDDAGKPLRMIGINHDITARRQAEAALRESEQRLRSVFNAVDGVPIQGYDRERRVIFWNPASERLYGFSRDEALGQRLEDLIIPEGMRETVIELTRRWYEEGIPVPAGELELLHRSGEPIPVYSSHVIVTNHLGEQEMFCIDVDLSQVRRAERRMAAFAAVVENSDNIVVVKDLDLRVVATNQTFARFAGHASVESMIGKTDAEIFGVTPDTEPVRSYMADERLAQTLPPGESLVREEPVIRPNGEKHVVLTKKYPIYTATGERIGTGTISTDITEQKQAEEALQEKQRELLLAQRFASIGNWSLDPAVGVPVWSDQVYRIYERDPELGPLPLADYPTLYSGEDWDRFHTSVSRAVQEGRPYNIELRLTLPSGTEKWVHAICEPDPTPGPKGHFLRGTIQDITRRKKAAEQLRESEERFRSLVESANDIVYTLSPEQRFTYLSPSWTDRLGHAVQDAIGKPFEEYVHPDDVSTCRQYLTKLITKGERQSNILYRVRHRDDAWRWHVSNISPMRDASGKVSACLGISRDVTEMKNVTDALRESEGRFRSIFEHAPIGIALVGLDYQLQAANRAYCQMLGYSEKELRKLRLEDFTHPDDFEENMRRQRRLAAGEIREYTMEKRFVRRDGSVRWGLLTACLLTAADGRHTGFLGHVLDITDQKLLQERMRQMEKMDAIGQLAGGVAHDFNNQLAGIMGYGDMLLERVDEPRLRSCVERILTAAHRAADLTAQLLTFARKDQQQHVPTDMHAIVHEVVAILERSIDKRIRIRQRLDADARTVAGDPTQLQNAILNLGVNARDALPEGGELTFETRNIAISPDDCTLLADELTPGPYLELCVRDTGCGMTAEVQTRIFEPFFTTKEIGKGTGMGLAAVYGTIKHHAGTITVDSAPGRGTVFIIRLPLVDAPPTDDAVETKEPDSLRGKRILVIDDEEILREMAADLLEFLDCKVHTEPDGVAGADYYRDHWQQIDCIILDMIMPRMGGAETFRILRQINPDARVIIASGFSAGAGPADLLAEGAAGFLQKPFRQRELTEALMELFKGPPAT